MVSLAYATYRIVYISIYIFDKLGQDGTARNDGLRGTGGSHDTKRKIATKLDKQMISGCLWIPVLGTDLWI